MSKKCILTVTTVNNVLLQNIMNYGAKRAYEMTPSDGIYWAEEYKFYDVGSRQIAVSGKLYKKGCKVQKDKGLNGIVLGNDCTIIHEFVIKYAGKTGMILPNLIDLEVLHITKSITQGIKLRSKKICHMPGGEGRGIGADCAKILVPYFGQGIKGHLVPLDIFISGAKPVFNFRVTQSSSPTFQNLYGYNMVDVYDKIK